MNSIVTKIAKPLALTVAAALLSGLAMSQPASAARDIVQTKFVSAFGASQARALGVYRVKVRALNAAAVRTGGECRQIRRVSIRKGHRNVWRAFGRVRCRYVQ